MNGVSDLIERMREERPRLGHLLSGMRFKQDLVARIGVEAAFPIAMAELDVPGVEVLRRRAIRPLHDVARAEGTSYRALWEGGTEHRVPSPRVIGAGDHAPLSVIDRSAYLTCLDSVTVRGHSSVVLRGEHALFDAERDEYRPQRDSPEFDPAILKATIDTAWTMEPGRDSLQLRASAEALRRLCGRLRALANRLPAEARDGAAGRLDGWYAGSRGQQDPAHHPGSAAEAAAIRCALGHGARPHADARGPSLVHARCSLHRLLPER
jgi:hypothetical protein